jgi:serine/threonine protein kinase
MLANGSLLQNRYQIIKLLDRGGMGAIYEAKDQRLGTTVALKQTFFFDPEEVNKLLNRQVSSQELDILRYAFEREARLLAGLKHLALPKVTDYFIDQQGQFLVMEFVPGENLYNLVKEQIKKRGRPFSYEEVKPWIETLLDVLDYLHSQNPPILHRDIKPLNIRLTPEGKIILLDFGAAKGKPIQDLGSSGSGYTQFSLPLWSPYYASPEQRFQAGTDPRSDIYSVSATFYFLLTGINPPDVNQRSGSLSLDPLDSQPENSLIPPNLLSFLKYAMSLDRFHRPVSAKQMKAELGKLDIYQSSIPETKTESLIINSTLPNPNYFWQVIGGSVCGKMNQKFGLANRDAIGWLPEGGKSQQIILVLADGQDKASATQSDKGSKVAVEETLLVLKEFLSSCENVQNFSQIKRIAEELPKLILRKWKESVKNLIDSSATSKDEIKTWLINNNYANQQNGADSYLLAYDTTMAAVVINSAFTLYLQLGMGCNILVVSEQGKIYKPSETVSEITKKSSFCSLDAKNAFMTRFQVVTTSPPALILLASNGYSQSFRTEKDFLQVGEDILQIIRAEGLEKVSSSLKDWLRESAYTSKGDDSSLGIIYRVTN